MDAPTTRKRPPAATRSPRRRCAWLVSPVPQSIDLLQLQSPLAANRRVKHIVRPAVVVERGLDLQGSLKRLQGCFELSLAAQLRHSLVESSELLLHAVECDRQGELLNELHIALALEKANGLLDRRRWFAAWIGLLPERCLK